MASLQGRVLALVLAVAGAVWLGAAWFSVLGARHELDELLDGHLAQAAALLIAQGRDFDADDVARDGQVLHRYAPRVVFQVWHEGQLVLRSANAPTAPLARPGQGFEDTVHGGEQWRVFAARGLESDIQVYVGERFDARGSILRAVMRGMFMPLVLGLPLLALVVWPAVRGGLAPLRRLAEILETRAPAALQPIALGGKPPAELRATVRALDGLFARVGQLLERERRFTADAAHELRTPVAAIAAQAEAALGATDEAARRHALQATRAGCTRAAHLVDQMLTLARLEGPAAPARQRFDLAALARRTAAELLPAAEARDQQVEIDGPATCLVESDETLLGVLLRNLVDNSLRHGPSGTHVQLSLEVRGPCWSLTVADSGPGLDRGALARLGERFFRQAGAETEGSGLGWSIVRRIADVLRLRVDVDRSPALGGLAVSVSPAD
jgi:two-component system, OmpR family, sensor histidine kinase QseC